MSEINFDALNKFMGQHNLDPKEVAVNAMAKLLAQPAADDKGGEPPKVQPKVKSDTSAPRKAKTKVSKPNTAPKLELLNPEDNLNPDSFERRITRALSRASDYDKFTKDALVVGEVTVAKFLRPNHVDDVNKHIADYRYPVNFRKMAGKTLPIPPINEVDVTSIEQVYRNIADMDVTMWSTAFIQFALHHRVLIESFDTVYPGQWLRFNAFPNDEHSDKGINELDAYVIVAAMHKLCLINQPYAMRWTNAKLMTLVRHSSRHIVLRELGSDFARDKWKNDTLGSSFKAKEWMHRWECVDDLGRIPLEELRLIQKCVMSYFPG